MGRNTQLFLILLQLASQITGSYFMRDQLACNS